jgi:hypothetical protein
MCWWSSGYGAVDASQSLDKDKALRKNRLDAFHDLVAQEEERKLKSAMEIGNSSCRGARRFFVLLPLRASANLRLGVGRDEPGAVCGAWDLDLDPESGKRCVAVCRCKQEPGSQISTPLDGGVGHENRTTVDEGH